VAGDMGELPMIENFHAAVFPADSIKPFDVNDVTRVNKDNTGDHSLFPLPIITLPGGPSPIKPPSTEIVGGAIIGSGSFLTAANDACRALPEWRIENEWGQVIAEDRGDGTGAHYYKVDDGKKNPKDKGKLVDENGNIIQPGDENYEDKRVEIKGTKEIRKWISFVSFLNGISGYAFLNGEITSIQVLHKDLNGEWFGFTINGRENLMNWFSGNWLNGGNAILESMSPESYVVMEIRQLEIDEKGRTNRQTWNAWHYNYDETNDKYYLSPFFYTDFITYYLLYSLFSKKDHDVYIRP